MILAMLWIMLTMLAAAPPPGAAASTGGIVVQTTVGSSSRDPAVVTFAAGSDASVALGDRFWVFDRARVVGSGTVFLVAPTSSAGLLAAPVGAVARGLSAAIVRGAALVDGRDVLPEGVTLRGRLVRLPPGRRTAWLDLGARAGLRVGDMLLVSRNGIPIARGHVVIVEDQTALASLRPVVGNALPQADDAVELWPAPAERRQGRLNSIVLEVRQDRDGPLIRFVGSSADGLVAGRLVDLYRRDAYVGVAVITDVLDPISVAQMIESASARPAGEGDVAVVRPAPPDQPIRAAIFKVAGADYCLFAAGEGDGVQVGEKFAVYRSDPEDPSRRQEVAELTVDAVKFYHSVAAVRMPAGGAEPLLPWEFAERRKPPWPRWGAIGVVKQVDRAGRWATADVDPRCRLRVGQLVRCAPMATEGPRPPDKDQAPGAAVVLAGDRDEAILHVPPAWGDLEHLDHAQVEVLMDSPAKGK